MQYFLSLDENHYPLTPEVGNQVHFRFLGKITCIECGRRIKKTYNQGYCFPCARDLPENALCSVRPELCEHETGTQRDREFYAKYCAVDHFVYLSLTSGIKVGVTRHSNIPTRWIDQGAVKALIIARVPKRILSGQIEVAVSKRMADKTNWRKMLKGEAPEIDLEAERAKVFEWFPADLRDYALANETVKTFTYPIQSLPEKITSHNLDKNPEFSDRLTGIKGQYLIFENRVINLRKYAGYHVGLSVEG